MNSLETENISEILQRTPNINPYYNEVSSAIRGLRNGDISSGPVWKIIHGYIGANEKKGLLGSEWQRYPITGGMVIPHRDFLTIQDEFPSFERGLKKDIPWNAEKSLEAIGGYIKTGKHYRSRHLDFFRQALQTLLPHQVLKVQDSLKSQNYTMNDNEDITVVAIPSHLDNPRLWELLGLKGTILERIPKWAKMSEHGVILASRLYRDDNPRGHDLFSYNAKAVSDGEVPDMNTAMTRKSQHEFSHGPSDLTMINLLKVNTETPIYEGLAGALGEDGRENKQAPSFQELVTNPYPDDVQRRKDTAYHAGSRYWAATRNILQKRTKKPWPQLIGSGLGLAVDMSNNEGIMNENVGNRIATFLQELPRKLDIPLEVIESEYNDIGYKSSNTAI